MAFLRQKGLLEEAYLVGGSVRDLLLGREIKDFDIAIKGDTIAITKEFAYATDASFVLLDKEFSVARVVKGEYWLDISRLRCDSLFIDLSERDLTINAMAIPLSSLQDPHRSLIDVYGGLDDLRRGLIRMVSEENFIKDPLRIIRVFRFAATLNYSVDDKTLHAVKSLIPLIGSVSYERIADELRKIISCQNSAPIVKLMVENRIFTHIFAISFRDTLTESYLAIETMMSDIKSYFLEGHLYLEQYLSSDSRVFVLKFITLFERPIQSVEAARQLRLSNRETELIQKLIGLSGQFWGLYERDSGTDSGDVIGFFMSSKNDLYGAILLDLARHDNDSGALAYAQKVTAFYEGEYKKRRSLLPLITGEDLIKEFGLSSSPLFKKILSAIEVMTLCGKISSKDEALRAVSDLLIKNKQGEQTDQSNHF